MNLTDKLPKRLQPECRTRFRALYLAPTRVACEAARDELAFWLREQAQDPAAEPLYRDWDDFITFYDFPAEHWLDLRTSNPISSRSSPECVCARTWPSGPGSVRMNRPDFDGDSTAWRIMESWQSTAAAVRSSGGTRPSSGSGPSGWSSRPPASGVSASAR